MKTIEFKLKGKAEQFRVVDQAIRTTQFVRNKALRYWEDNRGVKPYDLNIYCSKIAKEFSFANSLNSQARQAAAERAAFAIVRFYENCKAKIPGKKGYPRYKKNCRSVEYKNTGWKLARSRKHISFTDKQGLGTFKLVGTWDLHFYQIEQIKRVRIIRRADGYYCQFCIAITETESVQATQKTVGLDVGFNFFYTDSTGHQEENPRYYRSCEKQLKQLQRRVSKKFKKPKKKGDRQSNRYKKAKNRLARKHLKVSRQRIEHAKRLARCVVKSNDLIVYEDLKVRNMVRNQKLAKSINDAGWYQFRVWVEHFGRKFGRVTVAVPPHYTSQSCSSCGVVVQKSLSTRTHTCQCGCVLDRDENAALNILNKGLSTTGHVGTSVLDTVNAQGDGTSTVLGENLVQQVLSLN